MTFKQSFRIVNLHVIIFFIWSFRICDCFTEVVYEGKKYVAEGSPFNISCIKSSYGVPKWTRNGQSVDALGPDYDVIEKDLPDDGVRMELRVKMALWKHRGHYKCDPMSQKSHDIEIVPSEESDEQMQNQPRIQLRPHMTLKLVCEQEENVVFPINWYKDGSRLLEEKENPRIRMHKRTLTISKATEADAGEYTCVIEMAGLSYPFADHLGSRIKVTYPARVEKFSRQIRPILNRNLSLECEVQGFPVPRVSWFVDGFPIEEFRLNDSRYDAVDNLQGMPGSVLFIQDVDYKDNRQITCTTVNIDGADETSAQLAVRENAIITNEEDQGEGVILTPGHILVLQCNNTDDPSAGIQWLKNGLPLNTSDGRILEEISNNSLVIKNTLESDCGNYTCKSANQEAIIPVRSIVKIAPVDSSRNVVQNQNIVLLCNVTQGTPLPTVQWRKDKEPLNMSDPRITVKTDLRGVEATEVIISDAKFEDRAQYTCIVTNEISSANATILVRVKDKYAALWPFLGICAEVAVLCAIIFIYEKRRQKPDFDESETEHNTENKKFVSLTKV
ncbi:unnamed protein product [Larinioides sclopetarius]|uniref:Ig-like domain-containing protein n=1 Tax=Larinioides sclopetarius TaxID=280406 RepID=A0AAV1Z481_9ARAC